VDVDDGRVARRVRRADRALDVLRPRLRGGDVVLVKASRGVGLDVLVERLADELGAGARAR
jgi:UDP-N-acetylmuramyl pentapeptide synthase